MRVLESVFDQLFAHRILLEGMVLKPNMVISGKKCRAARRSAAGRRSYACGVSSVTSRRRCRASPSCRAGRAKPRRREHLSLMNKVGGSAVGAHLQLRPGAAGKRAQGLGRQAENLGAGQKAFLHRARLNGLAQRGKYTAVARGRLSPRATEVTSATHSAALRSRSGARRRFVARLQRRPLRGRRQADLPRPRHRASGAAR